MTSDPIANFLTKIRNALMAKHEFISIRKTNILYKIAKILETNKYISYIQCKKKNNNQILLLKLKYKNGKSVINGIKRISKPGLRIYKQAHKIPQVFGGFGTSIISTSQGIISAKEAKIKHIGGEIICYIW